MLAAARGERYHLLVAITLMPYLPEHEPAVHAFNDRLRRGQPDEHLVFYSQSVPRWLPPRSGRDLRNEYFVAVEGSSVRGAYALKWQPFRFPDGQIRPVACYHHPLSEGIIDKAYASVGGLLLRDAMRRSPLLFCLGMGGYDRALPRMLIRAGWSHFLIPFHFRIVRPFRFLRQMRALRESPWRSALMDLAAFSGAGWLAWAVWSRCSSASPPPDLSVETNPDFSEWADRLWEESAASCSLTAVRDSYALSTLYPASANNLERLRVALDRRDVGWAVVGERRRDPKYGAMRVGSIVDCWASPGSEPAIVHAATAALERREVDLILTNQSHPSWSKAVEAAGFLSGPSNFIFAASRKLSELLAPFDSTKARMHLTRADGDGLPDNF